MNVRSKKLGLITLAAGVALVVGLIAVSQVAAVSGTLTVGSVTIAPGGQTTVSIQSNVPSPGLGAWTFDVAVANSSHVSIISCNALNGGVCNPNYPGQVPTVRFAGADANGLVGTQTLGTITLRCTSLGSSALNLIVEGFADSTVAHPEISATMFSGMITCRNPAEGSTSTPVPPTGTAHPAATPTLAVRAIVNSGSGGSSQTESAWWMVAALGCASLAGLAGYAVLRQRRV